MCDLNRGQKERFGACQKRSIALAVVILIGSRVDAEHTINIQTGTGYIMVVHDVPLEYSRLLDDVQIQVYGIDIVLLRKRSHGHHRAGINLFNLGYRFAHRIAGGNTVVDEQYLLCVLRFG